MSIGASILLIAIGAILTFAVHLTVSGLDLSTIGVILMVVGVLGLVVSMILLGGAGRRGRRTVVSESYDDDVVNPVRY